MNPKTCPTCHAPIGRPCRMLGGRERAPHEAREAAAHGREHDPAAEEQRRKNASAHHAPIEETAP